MRRLITIIPSCHLACAGVSFSFSIMLCSAWQLVSILIGNPQMMSENLSNENFSATNSSRNALYFSSVGEVHFDVNAIGCTLITSFLLGSLVVNRWHNIPPNPWPEPLNVTMKGEPWNLGPFNTGSLVSWAFSTSYALHSTSPAMSSFSFLCDRLPSLHCSVFCYCFSDLLVL